MSGLLCRFLRSISIYNINYFVCRSSSKQYEWFTFKAEMLFSQLLFKMNFEKIYWRFLLPISIYSIIILSVRFIITILKSLDDLISFEMFCFLYKLGIEYLAQIYCFDHQRSFSDNNQVYLYSSSETLFVVLFVYFVYFMYIVWKGFKT